MPAFMFELEQVLRQRERVEREHQVRVGAIERERLDLEGELRELQGELDAARDDLRARLGARASRESAGFSDVRAQARAVSALDRRGMALAERLAGVLARLRAARIELVRASSERRAIELLRDRRYERWLIEQRRREQRTLDDLAGVRAASMEGD